MGQDRNVEIKNFLILNKNEYIKLPKLMGNNEGCPKKKFIAQKVYI